MTITTSYPALTVGAAGQRAPKFIEHTRITLFEWCCQRCGIGGPGINMPEHHASGACGEVTKTDIVAPPTGFVDGGGI